MCVAEGNFQFLGASFLEEFQYRTFLSLTEKEMLILTPCTPVCLTTPLICALLNGDVWGRGGLKGQTLFPNGPLWFDSHDLILRTWRSRAGTAMEIQVTQGGVATSSALA